MACRTLVSCPGIEPIPPALGACSLNHWLTREVPQSYSFVSHWRIQFVFFLKELTILSLAAILLLFVVDQKERQGKNCIIEKSLISPG